MYPYRDPPATTAQSNSTAPFPMSTEPTRAGSLPTQKIAYEFARLQKLLGNISTETQIHEASALEARCQAGKADESIIAAWKLFLQRHPDRERVEIEIRIYRKTKLTVASFLAVKGVEGEDLETKALRQFEICMEGWAVLARGGRLLCLLAQEGIDVDQFEYGRIRLKSFMEVWRQKKGFRAWSSDLLDQLRIRIYKVVNVSEKEKDCDIEQLKAKMRQRGTNMDESSAQVPMVSGSAPPRSSIPRLDFRPSNILTSRPAPSALSKNPIINSPHHQDRTSAIPRQQPTQTSQPTKPNNHEMATSDDEDTADTSTSTLDCITVAHPGFPDPQPAALQGPGRKPSGPEHRAKSQVASAAVSKNSTAPEMKIFQVQKTAKASETKASEFKTDTTALASHSKFFSKEFQTKDAQLMPTPDHHSSTSAKESTFTRALRERLVEYRAAKALVLEKREALRKLRNVVDLISDEDVEGGKTGMSKAERRDEDAKRELQDAEVAFRALRGPEWDLI